MRRSLFIWSAAVAMVLWQAAPLAAQDDAEFCQIVNVVGTVSTLRRDETVVPAANGQVLARDDVVQTGADTRITLRCRPALEINVGPETTLRLDRLVDAAPGGGWGVQLLDGIAGFFLGDGGRSDFQVSTPSAVAAVRSTEWAMQVEDRATATFVRDGRVTVAAVDGAVTLSPGDGVDVTADSAIGVIKQWGDGRIAMFDALLGPDWARP